MVAVILLAVCCATEKCNHRLGWIFDATRGTCVLLAVAGREEWLRLEQLYPNMVVAQHRNAIFGLNACLIAASGPCPLLAVAD